MAFKTSKDPPFDGQEASPQGRHVLQGSFQMWSKKMVGQRIKVHSVSEQESLKYLLTKRLEF